MSIRWNRYGSLICRSLVLAGYLFLFAGQFNYRYYSIANFYIYGNGGTGSRVQLNTGLTAALITDGPTALMRPACSRLLVCSTALPT